MSRQRAHTAVTDRPYEEPYRPQVHFTARTGWLNDPNGLVFYDGEYHLFYQHNPHGTEWGNMTWGHAVSNDLVHWRQLPNAIEPYAGGTIFSGSAVVDHHNSSGLGIGAEKPLVAMFTHARQPFGQVLAYSNDRGRTWLLHAQGTPVLPNQGLDIGERDPRVLWHEPTQRWVMLLWVKQDTARFFVSDDLQRWRYASDFVAPGFYECPDLFELPIEDEHTTRWVLHDAAFTYWIGTFDGITFRPEAGPLRGDYGNHFYAAQTWTNVAGRVVQIAWMRGGEYPSMPFNQQMSFPCALTLRRTSQGLQLCRRPVAELTRLHTEQLFGDTFALTPGMNPLSGVHGDLFHILLEFEPGSATMIGLTVYGQDIRYVPASGALSASGCVAHLSPVAERIALEILVDRTSIEVFAREGPASISCCFVPPSTTSDVSVYAEGGHARLTELSVHRLRSVWR